jgi:hypothetical protein
LIKLLYGRIIAILVLLKLIGSFLLLMPELS